MAPPPFAGGRRTEQTMAKTETVAAQGKISEIVQGLLAKRAGRALTSADQNLTESGLTSLDMVNLMLAIEDAFDIEIPQRRMTPANFRTVSAIENLVATIAMAA
jgi:acyl carrier protein